MKRYIEREGLSGVLNNTKWQRLIESLEPMQGKLQFWRKDVRENSNCEPHWDGDIYHMLGGADEIEWLCINAIVSAPRGALIEPIVSDYTEELISAVKAAGVPYSRIPEGIKIWGYLRSGVSPDWES